MSQDLEQSASARTPKLLDQVRQAVRLRHFSPRTEKSYVAWIRRYIRFHALRHPRELGAADVTRFLASLAEARRLSASSQTQALSALLFLYREVLHCPLESVMPIPRAKQPVRLPVVLDRDEVRLLLARLVGPPRTAALLMYGSGLRLLEVLQLRVKDLDFGMGRSSFAGRRAASTG
jgi:integrase